MIKLLKPIYVLFNPKISIREIQKPIQLIAFTIVASVSWWYFKEVAHGGQFYKTSSWLINNEGGFIRRGLIGQVLYMLSKTGINILWSTFAIQLLPYLVSAFLILKLFFFKERSVFYVSIIFSPAFFFLFPFYDSGGGFRKEILVFLSFTLLATCFIYIARPRHQLFFLICSIFTFLFAALEHEVAALCLPFFIFLLYLLNQNSVFFDFYKTVGAIFLYTLIAISALVIAYYFPGSHEASIAICQSLINVGVEPYMCDGAISWVRTPLSSYQSSSLKMILASNYLPIYGALFLLAFLPILFTNWLRKRWLLLLIGFVTFLPLFYITTDWGRWLAIYFFMVFITMLVEPIVISTQNIPLILICLYSTTWSIPHYGGDHIGRGVVNTYQSLFNPLRDSPFNPALWDRLGNYYNSVESYPPEGLDSQKHWVGYLAETYSLKSKARNRIEFNRNMTFDKPTDSKTFYIVSNEASVSIRNEVNPSRDFFGHIDGFNVLAPGWKACQTCKQFPVEKEILALPHRIQLGELINFTKGGNGIAYMIDIGSAWAFPETWGTWSTSKSASLAFPLVGIVPSQLSLVVRTLIAPQHDHQLVNISVDGAIIKSFNLTDEKATTILIPLSELNLKKGYLVLHFDLPNPVKPKDIGMGDDTRELAIGLITARFD